MEDPESKHKLSLQHHNFDQFGLKTIVSVPRVFVLVFPYFVRLPFKEHPIVSFTDSDFSPHINSPSDLRVCAFTFLLFLFIHFLLLHRISYGGNIFTYRGGLTVISVNWLVAQAL